MHDDWVRAVAIPASEGAITGIYAGLLMLAVCIWRRWPYEFALIAGCTAALAMWFYAHNVWMRIIAGMLLPQPEWEPAPKVIEPTRIVIEREVEGYHQGEFIDLPAQPDQLRQLAEGINQGMPFTFGAWAGAGKVFTQSEFSMLQAELLRRKLIAPRNPRAPNQGYQFTVAGVTVIKKLASPTLLKQGKP